MRQTADRADALKAAKQLGLRLRKLREEQGLSLAALSIKLRFSVVDIVAIEDGNWLAFNGSHDRYLQSAEALAKEMGLELS